MEEPLLTANVTDRRLGDGDTLEPARRELGRRGTRRLHLLDVSDPDHMADRQDAGHPVAVHHREVPETPLAEHLETLRRRCR